MRTTETKLEKINMELLGSVMDITVTKAKLVLNLMYDPTILITYSDDKTEEGSLLLNLHELTTLGMDFIRERITLVDIMYYPDMVRVDLYIDTNLVYSEKESDKSELEIILNICQWLINNQYEVRK